MPTRVGVVELELFAARLYRVEGAASPVLQFLDHLPFSARGGELIVRTLQLRLELAASSLQRFGSTVEMAQIRIAQSKVGDVAACDTRNFEPSGFARALIDRAEARGKIPPFLSFDALARIEQRLQAKLERAGHTRENSRARASTGQLRSLPAN